MSDLAEKVKRLRELRDKYGRSTPFDVAVGAPVRPKAAPSREETEKFIESVHDLKAAGATCVWTTLPVTSRSAYLESVAWFGVEIIPIFSPN